MSDQLLRFRVSAAFGLLGFVGLGGVLGGAALVAEERVPPPEAGSTAIICHASEPGRRLLVSGVVVDESGRPVRGATVSAYNTDSSGLYNPRNSDTREPRISGEVKSDAQGRFQFLTVYPGPYPEIAEPAHVHFGARARRFKQAWATIWIEGDPLITAERKAWEEQDEETRVVPAESIEGLAFARVTIVMKRD
ncbi:MAG: carboxypeptidase regulatory-like domain-containing protein [Phycisphaeraceae bacterium]|nr:carboxypeptidase regulatory-like domain-containing protein [Phycisphaeraceae bacterium]MBX3365773.1 carboxypeptidase regulatory-like domain-containing protein [Phycisphaeraceae bacterium]